MIFGGSDAIHSKRQHKVCYREACAIESAIHSFLSWSDSPITFDQRDHPSHITRPGHNPLIVDAIVRKKRLTKVLMDGGSGLNILYDDTLDAMHIPRSKLRPEDAHRIKGGDVENVEATASIHQHLGEALLVDNGVNDERVMT